MLNITPETRLRPFVKWVGGKTQLLYKLTDIIPDDYKRYYEPFIGGGALFFDHMPTNAVIGDKNYQLINAYRCVKDKLDDLLNRLNKLNISVPNRDACATYYQRRERFNKREELNLSDVECAALFIWLNKHCFNGIYRVNANGMFNVPWNRKSKKQVVDVKNLRGISEYLNTSNIQIINGDFEETCATVSEKDFVYIDSPYVPVSMTANFTTYCAKGFSMDDHKRLAEFVKVLDRRGAYVLISNNDVPLVREMYKDFHILPINVLRSINRDGDNRHGNEVIITNYE